MGCGRGVTRKVASSIPSEGKYTAISRISGRVFGSRCKHLVSEPRSSSFIPRGSRGPGLPFIATQTNGHVGEREKKETEGGSVDGVETRDRKSEGGSGAVRRARGLCSFVKEPGTAGPSRHSQDGVDR